MLGQRAVTVGMVKIGEKVENMDSVKIIKLTHRTDGMTPILSALRHSDLKLMVPTVNETNVF